MWVLLVLVIGFSLTLRLVFVHACKVLCGFVLFFLSSIFCFIMTSIFRRASQSYSRYLETHPVVTKSLTSCGLAATADVVAQSALENRFDPVRTIRFSSFSLFFGE